MLAQDTKMVLGLYKNSRGKIASMPNFALDPSYNTAILETFDKSHLTKRRLMGRQSSIGTSRLRTSHNLQKSTYNTERITVNFREK